jgi:hypothetical protein
MTILKKRAELLAQSEMLQQYMSYAHQCFPNLIADVHVDDIHRLLASVYQYSEWSKLLFDLNPITANKVKFVSGNTESNDLFEKQFSEVGETKKYSLATRKVFRNLITSITNLQVRSTEMYFVWYLILHENIPIIELCKNDELLLNKENLDLDDLIDLSLKNLTLKHYSRFFSLKEPEVINQWIISKSDMIDKKIKHALNPIEVCSLLTTYTDMDAIYKIDPSQTDRDTRYGKCKKIILSFPEQYVTRLTSTISKSINKCIVDPESKSIHAYLTANQEHINSFLDNGNLPIFKNSGLNKAEQQAINSYISLVVWIMNQIVDIPNYYTLMDLTLNHNGLITVKPCYRENIVIKPYRAFCRTNKNQPTVNVKKMITSFDMTKLVYYFLDHLKDLIGPVFCYITAINQVFDRFSIQANQPISGDIYLNEIEKRIDYNFKKNLKVFQIKNDHFTTT